jgi:hypothetical protein
VNWQRNTPYSTYLQSHAATQYSTQTYGRSLQGKARRKTLAGVHLLLGGRLSRSLPMYERVLTAEHKLTFDVIVPQIEERVTLSLSLLPSFWFTFEIGI